MYSLGVLLYHLATGSFPVPGRTWREVRRAHARGDRRTLASVRGDLPRPVARTIERALSVAPENRFADAEAFAAALRGVHARAARYRHAAIIAAAAIVLIVAAVTITSLLSGRSNDESRGGAGVSMEQIDPTVQQRFHIRGPSFGGGFAPCIDRRQRDLGICNLRTGEIDVLRRPTPDAGPVDQPMPRALISADGERLAYLWTHRSPDGSPVLDALHVIEVRTHRDQELHRSDVMELTRWTPDGTAIVARDGRDDTGKYLRIPIDLSQPQTLLRLTPDDDRHGDLSPDGRTMLIARVSAAGDRDLFGIDVATGEERWARKDASDDADPRWTPDGTGIVFVTDLAGCESLAVLRMNGGAPERNPALQLPFGATRTRLYGFGPDGSLLIDQSPYTYSTWLGSIDLGRATVSNARLLRQSQCDMAMGADWSPDRSRVSYVAGRPVPGARARLVIQQPEGMNREEIVLEHPFVTFAQTKWAPNGQRLAVLYRTGRPLTGEALEVVTIVDPRERHQQVLFREPIVDSGVAPRQDPAWDPTGIALYFRDGQTIVRVNLQAPKPEFKDAYRAPDGEALDRGLDVSRTGTLAVGHVRVIGTGPKQRFGTDCVVRVVSSDPKLLYRRSVPGSCQSLTWTRDGRRIVVGTRTAEKSVLWLIDPVSDSGTPLDAAAPEPNFWHLSLHPDDDRLLFMAGWPVQRPNMIHIRGLR